MELKTIEVEGKTYAEVQDGKPVYLDAGKEIAFDAVHASDTIKRLNGEAKGHREAKEAAESALKGFEGIEDPKAALKALDAVKGLDSGKLLDAEKVAADRKAAVDAAVKEFAERAERAEAAANEANKSLRGKTIGYELANSKFIKEQMARDPWEVERLFGDQIDIDGGKVIAKDANGNPIYSKAKPGELAALDEALEILVDQSPNRDSMLKGRGQNGSGAPGGGTGGAQGKTMTRAQYEQMARDNPAAARQALVKDGVTLTD